MENEQRLDLIDRSSLGIGKAKREAFENPAYADGWNSAIAIIENAPTVDAVEVVRCKDCKHCSNNTPDGLHWCNEHEIGSLCDDDFCSYGERRDGE